MTGCRYNVDAGPTAEAIERVRGPSARYASLGMTTLLTALHFFFIISSRFALNSVPGFHSGNLSAFATS
jgi:hypothetical protein